MYYYRITKYDSAQRNEQGHYMHDEWTDYSCIGHTFDGVQLTQQEYERVEALYVSAVTHFMDCLSLSHLTVTSIERYDDEVAVDDVPEHWRALYADMRNGFKVPRDMVPDAVRLILRTYVWCKLEHGQKMFVHFGYDYYMYVGVVRECADAVQEIEASGLFVEEFVSPYLADNANL